MPTELKIWIAGAQLIEQQHSDNIDEIKWLDAQHKIYRILRTSLKTMENKGINIDRENWLDEAKESEKASSPVTAKAIVKAILGKGTHFDIYISIYRNN